MEIIVFIIIIIAIVNASKSKTGTTNQQPQAGQHSASVQRTTAQPNTYRRPSSGNEPWKQAARENIEKAARRASAAANKALNEIFMVDEGVASPETEDMSAAERIKARRMEERKTTILQRARGNTKEQKEDVTLNTMEAEHNHSERVSAAVHNHPEEVIPENVLGTLDDLMIKGYDGNLCFERDFVGEAMDMISRFTVPSEVNFNES